MTVCRGTEEDELEPYVGRHRRPEPAPEPDGEDEEPDRSAA